jgi:hypothetical protein
VTGSRCTGFQAILTISLPQRSEWVQAVVCHERVEAGMLGPLCRRGTHNATGHGMADLASLAKEMERAPQKLILPFCPALHVG